jgi:hypothetical protein
MNTEFLTNGDDDEVHMPIIRASKLTEADLVSMIRELFSNGQPGLLLFQECIDKGLVIRTDLNLNLCGNPKCTSCREWNKAIHDTITEHWNSLDKKRYGKHI